jgi:hypothetical protein
MVALKTRLGSEAKALIAANSYTNCQSIIKDLEARFKPQGAGTFIKLCDSLNNMTLSAFTNLEEYTKEFRRINKDIFSLDLSLALPGPYIVQRYLQGLGPQFHTFRKTFNQINDVIPLAGIQPISFDQTVLKAETELANHTQDEIQSAFFTTPSVIGKPAFRGALSEKINGDTKTVVVPHCSYCHKDFHTRHNCGSKHPHIKAELEKKWATQASQKETRS